MVSDCSMFLSRIPIGHRFVAEILLDLNMRMSVNCLRVAKNGIDKFLFIQRLFEVLIATCLKP